MNNYTKLIIFIILLLAGFGIAILILSWPSISGKTYTLATGTIDPFDILMGQYATLNYEISRIQNIPQEARIGDSIYVSLEEDDSGIFRYGSTSLTKPQNNFIKGKIKAFSGNTAIVEYGIETFYFERGASFSMRNITVEVKVSNSGKAVLSRILQNGSPLAIEYRISN